MDFPPFLSSLTHNTKIQPLNPSPRATSITVVGEHSRVQTHLHFIRKTIQFRVFLHIIHAYEKFHFWYFKIHLTFHTPVIASQWAIHKGYVKYRPYAKIFYWCRWLGRERQFPFLFMLAISIHIYFARNLF